MFKAIQLELELVTQLLQELAKLPLGPPELMKKILAHLLGVSTFSGSRKAVSETAKKELVELCDMLHEAVAPQLDLILALLHHQHYGALKGICAIWPKGTLNQRMQDPRCKEIMTSTLAIWKIVADAFAEMTAVKVNKPDTEEQDL
jgi:hypothetical protein